MRMHALTIALACAVLPACLVPAQAVPAVDVKLDVLSQYNHRGMVQNENPVLQGEALVSLPGVRGDDQFSFKVFGNMDLENSTGDAWFPDGHGMELTETDVAAWYSRPVGRFFLTGGIFHYGLANGGEFTDLPSLGGRAGTTEVFIEASTDIRGFSPALTVHYDIDEVEDAYVEANVMRAFELRDRLGLEVDLNVAFSGSDASLWTYGFSESGLADARLRAQLFYDHDEHTTLRAIVAGSTILDSDIEDWFDLVGIESDNVWAGIGVTWSY